MMKKVLVVTGILGLMAASLSGGRQGFLGRDHSRDDGKKMALVTYVSSHEHYRLVRALVKSVRELSGTYRNSRILVVRSDSKKFPCQALANNRVELLDLEMDESFLEYPLAIKAFAAAQAEERLKGANTTLTWLDPGVIVLGSLDGLDLEGKFDCAVRPVSLTNNIGIPPGVEPGDYWGPIYEKTGLNPEELTFMQTIVDEVDIQPYYNCEVFSINPKLGICSAWATLFSGLLSDEDYQKKIGSNFLKKLFLHQAVLSAVIASKIKPDRIKPLPVTSGYPFNQHERLSPKKKVSNLNESSVVIFDYAWDKIPNWMEKIKIQEPVKQWLFDTYLDYMKLAGSLYRMEGSCNSYLVTTKAGSVLIDPAGASAAPEFFKVVLKKYPLKAILLTHAHQDHWDHMDLWLTDPKIPIVAQREFNTYNAYRDRMSAFFARRGAIWARKPLPDPAGIEPFKPVLPTVLFSDTHTLEVGGVHFVMNHTPGETPDHSTIWIPELKAVFVGDNYYEYFINNATLRGTLTRPVQGYIRALDLALSYQPEYFLMGHGSSIVSRDSVREIVSNFRDALRYVYDETIKGINQGKNVHTLMREIRLPARFRILPYFGKVEWTVRGIFHETVGWFDENPGSMYSLPATAIYPDLVEICGSESLIHKADEYIKQEDFVKALHLTDVVLASNPDHQQANQTRLKALEALKARTFNYIERIWLDYGIRTAEQKLNN